MATLPLLATVGGFFMGLTTVVFCLVCVLLVLLVLLQPAQSEGGLAGAFGGAGTDTFFGTKALSYAWKLTIGLAVTYIVLAVVLTVWHAPATEGGGRSVVPSSGK